MEGTYTWLIYSCLFFGSGILCDTDDSCSLIPEDNFYCSNGLCVEWSWVCDGRNDCSDGTDENKELCAPYEYGTNMTSVSNIIASLSNNVVDCGRVYSNHHQYIENGELTLVGTAPWSVGIYRLNKKNLNYHLSCGGSIIAPNVVISAAQCFWQDGMLSNIILVKDRQIVVVVVIDDNATQLLDVEKIYLKEGYYGGTGFHVEDIAVIVLASKVSFTNGVAPVCIDWNSIYDVKNGDQGMVTIWDKKNITQSPILSNRWFQYIDPGTCRNINLDGFNAYVTFDKFCTDNILGNTNLDSDCTNKRETNIDAQHFGGGISFVHFNSYYLTGILSIDSNGISGTNNSLLGFTDIHYHINWIRDVLNKHFTGNSCVLPTAEGVVYSYEGSNETLSHGTLINRKRTVIENCQVGYHKAYTYSFRYCLGRGRWLFNFEKLCFKMCPPLSSDSLDIKCSHNGKYANCSNLSIPDTIATTSCKPTYISPYGQDEAPLELHCQSNGTWNKQLYSCNPYCGRVYIQKQGLIENSEKALVGTAPWNVGIYKLNKIGTIYDLMCGGSLIAPNLVVSAAHCFWKKGMLSNSILINDGLYKIAVGKYERNFSVIDNEFTQIMNVEIVYLKEGYNGPTGFHAEDIAIIVLQNRVSFSNGVAPVCIDWNGIYNVSNGARGKIVSWGKTETGISSPILLEASLSYIDHRSCRNMYTNGFKGYVTDDKFCAGSASGQEVDKGSGAGLCFVHSNSYYLTGVASMKNPNRNNSIAAFTEVKYHIQWIRGLYNKHNYIL